MKLREIPRAQLGLLITALATQPNDDNSRIALAKKRDAYLGDAGLPDDEKSVFLAALQAAESAPVTADATAALAKFGELKEEGEEAPAPAPLHRGISEDALAAARQELNPPQPEQPEEPVDSKLPQGPGSEGLDNPVLPPDAEVPTDEQPAKRGPGRPRKDA